MSYGLITIQVKELTYVIKVSHKFLSYHIRTLTGYFYINVAYLLIIIYDIGFNRSKAFLKYVSLVTQSFL